MVEAVLVTVADKGVPAAIVGAPGVKYRQTGSQVVIYQVLPLVFTRELILIYSPCQGAVTEVVHHGIYNTGA